MPNWASNIIEIYGEKEVLEQIIAKGKEGEYAEYSDWNTETHKHDTVTYHPRTFSFENFVPTPKELLNGEGWYNWRVANWGTKWDIDQMGLSPLTIVQDEENSDQHKIVFGFNTAWSPAIEFWSKFSELYPTVAVENKYWEEGMNYIGQAFIQDGAVSDYETEITNDLYEKAGAEFIIEDGQRVVDWEVSEIEFEKVFPLV